MNKSRISSVNKVRREARAAWRIFISEKSYVFLRGVPCFVAKDGVAGASIFYISFFIFYDNVFLHEIFVAGDCNTGSLVFLHEVGHCNIIVKPF